MSGGTRSYEMARRLVEWGHEVHIVTSWRNITDKEGWFEETIDGINIHWLPVPYHNAMAFWARMRAFIRFALNAGVRAKSIGGDVVFATSTPLTIALPGALASWLLNIPMVFEVRDLWPDVPIAMGALKNPLAKMVARRLERFAYQRSSHVIALSQGMAEGVISTGYPKKRVSVIPNSSDLGLFSYQEVGAQNFRQLHPELGDGPIVLYPGTLGKANGVAYLVYLAQKILPHRADVRFVVIGDGAEAEYVRREAKKCGVAGVNFFQYAAMPKRRLVDAFSAASVVVSLFVDEPALRANSANKFFDALASGTPVAINYQGWQSTLIKESGAGVSMGADPSDAMPILLDILNSPERLANCGMRARELAEQHFSRDYLARKLEETLRHAVEGES